MADDYVQSLGFTVDGQEADTFTMFRLRGREAISELFRFEVEAVSSNAELAGSASASPGRPTGCWNGWSCTASPRRATASTGRCWCRG